MIERRLFLLLLVCVSCKPATQQPGKPAAAVAGPQVRATVVTIRTTVEPAKQTTTHTLVIAGDLARSTDELDSWRLFDVKKGTVTFVDDIAKTARTKTIQNPSASALPAHIPRVTWEPTGQKRALLGVNAEQSLIRVGNYRRELWIAKHRAIPEQLFSLIQLSDPPAHSFAAMTRAADDAIRATRGFPMLDRTELPYGKASKFVVERTVVDIAEKQVPKAMLEVPTGYKKL